MPKNLQVCGHGNLPINFQVRSRKKCKKCIGQHLCENAKNSQVCSQGKMPKPRRFVVTELCIGQHFCKKCQKLAGSQSQRMLKTRRSTVREDVTNLQLSGYGKMLKTRRSAVMEKCGKPAGLRSQKYANKLPGLPLWRNEKMYRSAFLRK